jgi:hypothetical protein
MARQRAIRIGPTDTVMRCSAELGRVYKQVARKEITDGHAKTKASILVNIREGLIASDLEQRVRVLERPALNSEAKIWKPQVVK